MRVPILRLNARVLVVALAEDMVDEAVAEFQDALTQRVARLGARGVVVDVSALDLVDSFMARVLNDTAGMLRLLGAEVVVCGLQPAVALTLVEMGRDLARVATTFTLEGALQRLDALMRAADAGADPGADANVNAVARAVSDRTAPAPGAAWGRHG